MKAESANGSPIGESPQRLKAASYSAASHLLHLCTQEVHHGETVAATCFTKGGHLPKKRKLLESGRHPATVPYVRKKSLIACHITCPPTSAIDLVSGMSLGHTSTQFCA